MARFTFERTGWDFSEAWEDFLAQVDSAVAKVGEVAVDYARENGQYRDVTGRLRRSNRFSVENHGLTLENTAPYAADVEARGLDVIGGAALFACGELKKAFR